MLMNLACCITLLFCANTWTIATCIGLVEQESSNYVLYTDIHPANGSDSLFKLKSVPIVHYKFLYDSVVDRSQIGIIGSEAQKFFPESIEVVQSKAIIPRDRTKLANHTITNFPIVDKNVLFMHGLVALQELIRCFGNLKSSVQNSESRAAIARANLVSLHESLQTDVNANFVEKLKLEESHERLASRQSELEIVRAREGASLSHKQLEEEKRLLEFEADLVKKRMQREEALLLENIMSSQQLDSELIDKKLLLKKLSEETIETVASRLQSERNVAQIRLDKERIQLELDAKFAEHNLANDIELKRMELQASLETAKMITGIKAVSTQVSLLVTDILARPDQVVLLALSVLGLVFVWYGLREFFFLIRQYIQTRLGKPSLVRETSVQWSALPTFVANWFKVPQSLNVDRAWLRKEFDDIILSDVDKERVIDLALATRNTKNSGAPFRHVLLHGTPGTGKTLIARRLAACSGMDYAIMSGGDVAPLGEDAVSQLHWLFQWATKSRRGLLVFIDEAEAFLSARCSSESIRGESGGGSALSDVHIRNALNALLYQTGIPSHSFMLVLATNRPQDLDTAVLDRIDVSLTISNPGLSQRLLMVKLYLDRHVISSLEKSTMSNRGLFGWLKAHVKEKSVEKSCTNDDVLQSIALLTEGFSGREIAKMCIAVQYSLFLSETGMLTKDMLLGVVQTKVLEHNAKTNVFC